MPPMRELTWHIYLLCLFSTTWPTATNGVHLPILTKNRSQFRRAQSGASGLGDYKDMYEAPQALQLNSDLAQILSYGSADTWCISDSCKKNCSGGLHVYPHKTLKYSGVDVRLFYGDTSTGTYAFGPVGKDQIGLANVSITSQYFAAINETDTTTPSTEAVGLLGLGFPVNSAIWNTLFNYQYPSGMNTSSSMSEARTSSSLPSTPTSMSTDISVSRRAVLSRLKSLIDIDAMQQLATVEQLIQTFITNGPVVARMSFSGILNDPSFTVTLQRDTVDVGGNVGVLSIGELPYGVSNDSLLWARVRQYSVQQGGIPASPAAPNETYPISWEIPLDGVYLDGNKLPESTLSVGVSLSALIDTGSSLIRGPSDTVAAIYQKISGYDTSSSYHCSDSHILEFEIGGRKFPIDPRDFGWQAEANSLSFCNASIVATDPPSKGFLYAWSLGVPFLKSVLASFHYGNLTHPSFDPPRIGFVSTMPPNAKDLLAAAIAAAGINFPAIVELAPIRTPNMTTRGIAGVALAPTQPAPPLSTASSTTMSLPSTTSSTSQPTSGAFVARQLTLSLIVVLDCVLFIAYIIV